MNILGYNPRWRNKKWKLRNKGRNTGKVEVPPLFKTILEERISFTQLSKEEKKNKFNSNLAPKKRVSLKIGKRGKKNKIIKNKKKPVRLQNRKSVKKNPVRKNKKGVPFKIKKT